VFDDSQVAKYWPEFQSKDSGLMKKKKLVPNLPKSINYLKDLHEDYKLTTTKQRFSINTHLKPMILMELIIIKFKCL